MVVLPVLDSMYGMLEQNVLFFYFLNIKLFPCIHKSVYYAFRVLRTSHTGSTIKFHQICDAWISKQDRTEINLFIRVHTISYSWTNVRIYQIISSKPENHFYFVPFTFQLLVGLEMRSLCHVCIKRLTGEIANLFDISIKPGSFLPVSSLGSTVPGFFVKESRTIKYNVWV